MISTAPLYDPRTHRYKGVYPGPARDQWDAIVTTPQGKLLRRGRHSSPEGAARAVIAYYFKVYGKNWLKIINDRRKPVNGQCWRVKRQYRYPYLADLHKGPKVAVYVAEVRLKDETWHKITPDEGSTLIGWNTKLGGFNTSSAALVACRVYRTLHGL